MEKECRPQFRVWVKGAAGEGKEKQMGKYDVAAYVWPAYTGREKRSLMF
jgi:hypothetical protein